MTCPVFEVENTHITNLDPAQRTLSLLYTALDEALKSGRLDLEKDGRKLRIGVCLGTTVACQLNDFQFYQAYKENTLSDYSAVKRYLNGNIAEHVKQKYNLTGPALTVVNACSSGTDAIGIGVSWIKGGFCDIVIAGGADELNRVPLVGFTAIGVASDEPCKPFDANRSGLNLGEGAGVLVLEAEASAKDRDVPVEYSVAGYGTAADAYHLTAPSPTGEGLQKAIHSALAVAGISTHEIGFINAHGTSTQENDKTECYVFNKLFLDDTPFLSTKGYTGHTLGAAGGIEAVFSILALKHNWIPASAGFQEKHAEMQCSPVTEKTSISKPYALSTSLAFGGNNSVVILKKENP